MHKLTQVMNNSVVAKAVFTFTVLPDRSTVNVTNIVYYDNGTVSRKTDIMSVAQARAHWINLRKEGFFAEEVL